MKSFNWDDPFSNTIETTKREAESMGIQIPHRLRKRQMINYLMKQNEKMRGQKEVKTTKRAKSNSKTIPYTNLIIYPERVTFYSSSLLKAMKNPELVQDHISISKRSPTPKQSNETSNTHKNKIIFGIFLILICLVLYPPLFPVVFILFLVFFFKRLMINS